MKLMYCWRCCKEVPMLDEEEFAIVGSLYSRAVRTIKASVRFQEPATRENSIMAQYRPVLDEHRRITGLEHTNDPSDLMHHRISIYGPPCLLCGKPLRTPRAKHCAACGATRQQQSLGIRP